jgi:hypothetical protein
MADLPETPVTTPFFARGLAGVTAFSPPATGVALIVVVVTNTGPSMITRSAAVAATAVIVGAILILGSAALYCWNPLNFLDFATTFAGRQTPQVTQQLEKSTEGS